MKIFLLLSSIFFVGCTEPFDRYELSKSKVSGITSVHRINYHGYELDDCSRIYTSNRYYFKLLFIKHDSIHHCDQFFVTKLAYACKRIVPENFKLWDEWDPSVVSCIEVVMCDKEDYQFFVQYGKPWIIAVNQNLWWYYKSLFLDPDTRLLTFSAYQEWMRLHPQTCILMF